VAGAFLLEILFGTMAQGYRVLLNREAGKPKPWTNDPILQQYKFTNIFREDDRVTIWLRDHVRKPVRRHPLAFPAVALFRWFNPPASEETLFLQRDLFTKDADKPRQRGRPRVHFLRLKRHRHFART
jgi:hypothetical protein